MGAGFFGQLAEECLAKGEACPNAQGTKKLADEVGPTVSFSAQP